MDSEKNNNDNISTEMISVLAIKQEGSLTGVVYKDIKLRKNVLFRCEEMDLDEIERIISRTPVKIKGKEQDETTENRI